MEGPRPGDVWLVRRDEVENEGPTLAHYDEWDDGDSYWCYFGTEWIDVAKGRVTVTPIELIYRKDR